MPTFGHCSLVGMERFLTYESADITTYMDHYADFNRGSGVVISSGVLP
jgi:hypothetical protein